MTESAQTIKDTVEILVPYLDKLADSIGNNGTYVFGLMVKQAYINGAMEIFNFILWIVIGYVYYRILIRVYKWTQREVPYDEYDGHIIWSKANPNTLGLIETISSAIGTAILFLIGSAAFSLQNGITILMNPEYNAIIQLLHAIK